MWCPNISSFLCKGPVLYPAKNEEIYGVVPYQKIFISCHITFKRKFQHVGHIWIVLWVKWVNRCDPGFNTTTVAHTRTHMHTHTHTHTHTRTHTHTHTQAHKHCMIHKYMGYKALIYLANT